MTDICPCCKRPLDKLASDLVIGPFNATRKGKGVRLAPRQVAILTALDQAWPDAMPYERLLQRIYGNYDYPEDPLAVVKVKISQMRKPLKALGVAIKNDYGIGYRLEFL